MTSSDLGFRNEVNPPLKVPLPTLISPKDKGHTKFGVFFLVSLVSKETLRLLRL